MGSKKTEWVSVKERWPEPDEYVLVWFKEGYMEMRYYLPSDGIHAWGWYPGGQAMENASHWRPLPDPPKG